MKLPKLYRKVWVKLYWLTDTCEGGEHVQREGHYYLEARRSLRPDNSWFWQLDKWDASQCSDTLKYVDDLDPIDMFEGWVYKNPFKYNENDNYGEVTTRMTIKEQKELAAIEEMNTWPF